MGPEISQEIMPNISGRTLWPAINKTVIIEGNGTVIERAMDAEFFRFFSIAPGGHLTLRNITLRGGLLEEGKGAAILNQGQLTLDNVTFENNCLVNDPCSDDDAIENDGGTVNMIGPVSYGVGTPIPPTATQTPIPTITPIMINGLTPVALPTRIAVQTPTSTP